MQSINYNQYYEIAKNHIHKKVENRVSCSSLPYLEKCSYFKNRQSESQEASLKGTTLHNILEEHFDVLILKGYELVDFPVEEQNKLEFIVSQLIEMTNEGWGVYGMEIFMDDEELGICGSVDLVLFHSGIGSYAILDYKTGMIEVDPSSAQIAGYGAMFMRQHHISKTWGGVIQYGNDMDALMLHESECVDRVTNIVFGKKKLGTSGNCRYCANLLTCPAIREQEQAFLKDGFDLKSSRDLVPVLEEKIKLVKSEATEHLQAGFYLEGYSLSSRTTRSVSKMGYPVIIEQIGIERLLNDDLLTIKVGNNIPSEFVIESRSEFAMKSRKKK